MRQCFSCGATFGARGCSEPSCHRHRRYATTNELLSAYPPLLEKGFETGLPAPIRDAPPCRVLTFGKLESSGKEIMELLCTIKGGEAFDGVFHADYMFNRRHLQRRGDHVVAQEELLKDYFSEVQAALVDLVPMACTSPLVLIACAHGHHRSVALAEILVAVLLRLPNSRRCLLYHLDAGGEDAHYFAHSLDGFEEILEGPLLRALGYDVDDE